MKSKRQTKEEKVAKTIIDVVNDLTIDLDLVGMYLSQQSSSVLYNRIDTVIDSARHHKEAEYDKQSHNPLF